MICFPFARKPFVASGHEPGGPVTVSRRDFVKTSVLGAVAASVGAHAAVPENSQQGHATQGDAPKRPIIICANNGYPYVEAAYAFLKSGGDTLDAGVRVVKGPEDDPNDDSVGLGGLPNEEGVVELDACCMHGPTRMAGSVGGVREIKNVSLLSKAVMEHTGHVMLVGEGAERFGRRHGLSPREPADRALAQDLAAVERDHVERRLVGTRPRRVRTASSPTTGGEIEAELLRQTHQQDWKQLAAKLGIEPEFRTGRHANACCFRRPEPSTARR